MGKKDFTAWQLNKMREFLKAKYQMMNIRFYDNGNIRFISRDLTLNSTHPSFRLWGTIDECLKKMRFESIIV